MAKKAGPTNTFIAAQLGQLAVLLRSEGANPFKVKAYRRAAEALRRSPERVGDLVAQGKPVPRLPGGGPSISSAIVEIVQSGSLRSIQRLGEKLPEGTAAIAEAAGISVREAQRLAKALKVQTPEEVRQKLRSGELQDALGDRLAFKVRQGLEDTRRLLWLDAKNLSEQLEEAVAGLKGVSMVESGGSLRRGQDTVGTLRLVVAARSSGTVRRFIREHGGVKSVLEDAESRMMCALAAGPLLKVRFADSSRWGDALVEETGSQSHLAEVARVAGNAGTRGHDSELAWYRARGLPWVPPELREGRGEVEAAKEGSLPTLVELRDIRGDLHAHTTESDGANTLEEMVAGARARGYSYLAITDHSKSLRITNGLDERRLRRQMLAIDKLNGRLDGFRVFKGSEVDILEDGSLDFDDALLKDLDIVMGSIHSRFGLDREQQTSRLLRAIANPYLTCLGHLTGRKLLKRQGYDLDLERVLRAVKKHKKLLEINASPDRLDIDDGVAKRAHDLGIPLLINTDAHSVRELDFMAFGVRQARRGWQSTATVVNAWDLGAVTRRLTR